MPGHPPLTRPEFAPYALRERADRPARAFRLTLAFMVLVILTFVAVEGWRTWRDYQRAYATARDSVANLARATAQHAEDAVRQVDILTTELRERVEGDGLANIDIARIHALMMEQSSLMPQLHGLFIYGPSGEWIVTDKNRPPDQANNSDRDYFIYHRTNPDRGVRIGEVVRSRSTGELVVPFRVGSMRRTAASPGCCLEPSRWLTSWSTTVPSGSMIAVPSSSPCGMGQSWCAGLSTPP